MEHSVDTNFDNDDFVSFQLDSKIINLYYSQLTKYSQHIRDQYLFSDVMNRFPRELKEFTEQFHLPIVNIILFFDLLQQNYNIKEDLILTYNQCTDLLKISNYLKVRKLSHQIGEYIKRHNIEVDFIIQMIQYEIQTSNQSEKYSNEISGYIEKFLMNKADECLTNDKFSYLPIPIIYRVLKQNSKKGINGNKLFDFILKSLNKFYVLFQFLEIRQLSDDRLEKLFEIYSESEENSRNYFSYMECNLEMIREMKERLNSSEKAKNEQKDQLKKLEEEKIQMKKQLEEEKNQIKKKLADSEKEKNEQKDQLKKMEEEKIQIKKQFKEEKIEMKKKLEDSEKAKNEQRDQMEKLETQINQLQKQLRESERTKKELEEEKIHMKKQLKISDDAQKELQKRLDEEMSPAKGQIIAKVKSDVLISARIILTMKGSPLDTTRSKYIISTSDATNLGIEAYKNGEQITSNEMDTIEFICKSGTYYVRCLVFNKEGKTTEIVSNSVKTRLGSVLFGYEGKAKKVSLFKGKYKLEVWGAKGGDSEGKRCGGSPGKGGLGGYSSGILTLKESETVHIFVGGEGRPSNSSDGSTTNGGFPDGGGTKTGHCRQYTSVPGTGGGSTSIRIKSDNDYGRIIVAGGGGGASGCCEYGDDGGFGGGLSGGNCYYKGSLQNQGSGTQAGSTCGLGLGSNGDPGIFGHGATGKYSSGCDSGGGGGGGWYGGGSGGYGHFIFSSVSSGGGGSGWTFTESNFSSWESKDKANASQFIPSDVYYLTDTSTISGDEEIPKPEGIGTEIGHSGNGYAKITPE